ncbi:hypothetical protein HanPSC8_Chr13g0590931 [Helianthus annuus]|nr:hypothetical protein HanHA89_Chr13g0535511 [Helianthus annuus]KAJ0851326.1 hypothetical protein HanPSC8_Chr13g0590931 [Helianthus annuus]
MTMHTISLNSNSYHLCDQLIKMTMLKPRYTMSRKRRVKCLPLFGELGETCDSFLVIFPNLTINWIHTESHGFWHGGLSIGR